jgi:hypothetical protein
MQQFIPLENYQEIVMPAFCHPHIGPYMETEGVSVARRPRHDLGTPNREASGYAAGLKLRTNFASSPSALAPAQIVNFRRARRRHSRERAMLGVAEQPSAGMPSRMVTPACSVIVRWPSPTLAWQDNAQFSVWNSSLTLTISWIVRRLARSEALPGRMPAVFTTSWASDVVAGKGPRLNGPE